MTTTEAAKLIGASERHIRTLINAGRLSASRVYDGWQDGAFQWDVPLDAVRKFLSQPRDGRGWPRGKSRKAV
jgi:excisionase family DNA binding protein